MARHYGRIKTSIWADDDFRDLSDAAQALYMRLLSSASLNLCGVCDWRPKRLAMLARDLTEAKVVKAAQELVSRRYIVIDEDTEEALVRTFIKHESIMANPKLAAGLDATFSEVVSSKLRRAIGAELLKLRLSDPDLKGWDHVRIALAYANAQVSDRVPDNLSGRSSDQVPDNSPILLKPVDRNHKPETSSIDGDFAAWYSTYPKKAARPKALIAYRKARTKTDTTTLLDGARLWAKAYATDTTYCPNPATWLNQERWTDPDAPTPSNGANGNHVEPVPVYEEIPIVPREKLPW